MLIKIRICRILHIYSVGKIYIIKKFRYIEYALNIVGVHSFLLIETSGNPVLSQ